MNNARNLANLLGTDTTIQTAKLADDAITTRTDGTALQTVSTNFTDILSIFSSDSTGVATGVTNGFSFVPDNPSEPAVKKSNSKYLIDFDGNTLPQTTALMVTGLWLGVFLLTCGEPLTQIGSGTNSSNSNNVKFYASRADASGAGNDGWHSMQLCGNYLYTSPHQQEQPFDSLLNIFTITTQPTQQCTLIAATVMAAAVAPFIRAAWQQQFLCRK